MKKSILALFLGLAVQASANNAVVDALTLPLRLPFILAAHGIVPVPVVVPQRVVVSEAVAPAPVIYPPACGPDVVVYHGRTFRPGYTVRVRRGWYYAGHGTYRRYRG